MVVISYIYKFTTRHLFAQLRTLRLRWQNEIVQTSGYFVILRNDRARNTRCALNTRLFNDISIDNLAYLTRVSINTFDGSGQGSIGLSGAQHDIVGLLFCRTPHYYNSLGYNITKRIIIVIHCPGVNLNTSSFYLRLVYLAGSYANMRCHQSVSLYFVST